MYWIRTGEAADVLKLIPQVGLWITGGWLMARHAFRLAARERLLVGIALGLSAYLWFVNLLGRLLPPDPSFWVASLLVLTLGLLTTWRSGQAFLSGEDLKAWRLIVLLIGLAVFLTLLGRGLGIFDDRKNLSYISIMAAGDIPPHFYMNSTKLAKYHYGFQLFGASLMRVGGLFPWSAFDVSKAIVAALALTLAILAGWRLTHRQVGGWILATLLAFASGARWLLLFLPQSALRAMSERVNLLGSAASTAPGLLEALGSKWVLEGGPPLDIPFAYVNGISQPLILGSMAGPGTTSVAILLTLLLILRRGRGVRSLPALGITLATLALTSETDFGLFALGLGVVAVVSKAWRKGLVWRRDLRFAILALALAGLIALFQGGTLTEVVRGILQSTPGGAEGSGTGLAGFSIRWPPALVSSHLGELPLRNPWTLLAAVFEIGPALLAAPLAIWYGARCLRRGHFDRGGFVVGTAFGFTLPIFLRYESDRDITRITAFAVLYWTLFALPALWWIWQRWRRSSILIGAVGWGVLVTFSGVVILGSMLTSLPNAYLSTKILPIDAHFARDYWDRLEADAEVFDSESWRAVVLTGRLTRAALSSFESLPSWLESVEDPDVTALAEGDFAYVYVDELWWGKMNPEGRATFRRSCVRLLRKRFDVPHWRALYDIRDCRSE